MWILSLPIFRLFTLWLLKPGIAIVAVSNCPNSFRFDHLCPDPRIETEKAAILKGAKFSSDVFIALYNLHNNSSSYYRKFSSRPNCQFFKYSDANTAWVNFVHITEKPWLFQNARQCSLIVKFNYDLLDTEEQPKVCSSSLGTRLDHKKHVYFWQTFTLRPNSVDIVDTITNYHWSEKDIVCARDKSKPQYVLIAVEFSKSSHCELIIQQYKISETRPLLSCADIKFMESIPFQFCGSYDCYQPIGLSSSKLRLRPDFDNIVRKNNEEKFEGKSVDWMDRVVRYGFPTTGIVLVFCGLFYLYSKLSTRGQFVSNGQPDYRQTDGVEQDEHRF